MDPWSQCKHNILKGGVSGGVARVANLQEPASGDTLLHYAARLGKMDWIVALVKLMVNVDVANKVGRTPLMEAVDNLACFKAILSHSNDELVKHGTWTTLMLACSKGLVQQVSLLLERPYQLKLVNKDGWTAFHLAVKSGNAELCQLLLVKDPSQFAIASKSKRLPIHTACFNGYLDIVKLLLSLSAEATRVQLAAKDTSGCSLLEFAVLSGHTDVVDYLHTQHGQSLGEIDSLGRSLVHFAAMTGNLSMLRHLFSADSSLLTTLQQKDKFDEWTPMHYAAKEGMTDAVEFLKSLGAPQCADKHGRTPTQLLLARQ